MTLRFEVAQLIAVKRMRLLRSRLTLVILAVAISVFGWGLAYKLSLYFNAGSSFHRVPEAKLLSQDEQARKAEKQPTRCNQPETTARQLRVARLLAALFAFVAATRVSKLDLGRDRRQSSYASASLFSFSFRPPPVLA